MPSLVRAVSEEQEALFCLRCFHALIHGMSPQELRERTSLGAPSAVWRVILSVVPLARLAYNASRAILPRGALFWILTPN